MRARLIQLLVIFIVFLFIVTSFGAMVDSTGHNTIISNPVVNAQTVGTSEPVINSITNIYATDEQNIYINGTGFGTNPELVPAEFGNSGCDTVYSNNSPSFAIMDNYKGNGLFDASCNWQAGFDNPNSFFSDCIGVFIKSWNNTNIILTGFGNALGNSTNPSTWAISPGNEITVIIDNPAYPEIAYYNLTVYSAPAKNLSNRYSFLTNSLSTSTGNATLESNTGQLTIISAISSQPIKNIYGFTNQYSTSSHIAIGELQNTTDNNSFSASSSSNYDATSIESVSISSNNYSSLGVLSYNSDSESNQTNSNLSFNISAPGSNDLLVIFTLGYTQVANGFCQNYGINVNGIDDTKALNGTYIQVNFGMWSSVGVNYLYLNSPGKYSVNSVVSSTDGSIELLGFVISPHTNHNYGVSFSETGLKSGTPWSVTLNGETESSTTSTIAFSEPNGTYSYSVSYIPGNTSSPSSGEITVNGANIKKIIGFSSISNNYLLYDNFISDNYINTTKWSIDSTVLENITNIDSNVFGWPITLVSPNDFSYKFDRGLSLYPNNGATSSVYDNMAGLTSNTVFTSPVAVNVNFTISDVSGGDSMIILSNATGGNMIGVFLGSYLYVQDGNNNPTDTGYNINPDVEYHLSISVENSKYTIDISGSGKYSGNFSYSPNGNQTLYLTFGSYIGTFSGEQNTHTETQAIVFQNISVESEGSWNLSVFASSSDGTPDSGVDITVVNAFTNVTASRVTPSNGTVKFSNLKSAEYYVIATQSQDGIVVTVYKHVFIGEPDDPLLLDIPLTIKIIPPPPPKLSVSISSINSTSAEAPWENTFLATPSGYVQNYSYKWYIDKKYAGDGYELNSTFYNPSGTGINSYNICLNVSSQGKWFGTVYNKQVVNTSITQTVYSKPIYINLADLSANQYSQISYGPYNNMAVGYIKGDKLYLNFNITNTYLKNGLPQWLMDIIGISYPYWGLNISDRAGNDNNILNILQPGSSASFNNILLPGIITSINQLPTTTFDLTLNPGTLYAIIGDIIQIVLALTGVLGGVSIITSSSLYIEESIVYDLIMHLAGFSAVNGFKVFSGTPVNIVSALVNSITNILDDLLPALPHILYSIIKQYAPDELKDIGGLIGDLSEKISAIFPGWKLFDLGFDIGAVIGAAIRGDLITEYEIMGYQNSINVCAYDPGNALPNVEILSQNGSAGWDGSWIGSGYSHSSFTASGYAFSIPANGKSTLEIYNPDDLSSMEYNINVSVGNTVKNLKGTLLPNSDVKYSVSSNSTSVSVTKEYQVTFVAKGLSTGTDWSVTLNGLTKSATTNTIIFDIANGTYKYTVSKISGYSVSSSGSIIINGSNLSKTITYTPTSTSSPKSLIPGIANTELYIIFGAAAAIAVVGASIAIIRRRR
jgi:hypothetical protein